MKADAGSGRASGNARNLRLSLLLAVAVLPVLLPFNIHFPASGLHSSWILGLSHASANGFVFGRDVIFTFGPFAYLLMVLYYPGAGWLFASVSIILAAEYLSALFVLLKGIRALWPVVFAAIYKARWQIELFFKWIKQNLKIKSFQGTSRNAVMTQVWVAMCGYLLLAYKKYQTKYAHSILELSRVIRETLLERKSLIDILTLKPEKIRAADCEPVQTALF